MPHTTLRVVFAGTPDFAAIALQALYKSEHAEVVGVYTQPDRPAGRGKQLSASPVKVLALQHGTPVEQPLNFRDPAAISRLQGFAADLMVVAAYGIIVPQAVLDTPRLGCINIHASLLPRWRGAAPIQRAIEAGDQETGITLMQMDIGLDTGKMLKREAIPVLATDTGSSLHDKLAVLGARMLVDALPVFPELQAAAVAQDDNVATYAPKLSKAEAAIDWAADANAIDRKVRALNSWPIASTRLGETVIRVWEGYPKADAPTAPPGTVVALGGEGIEIATGNGVYVLTSIQLPGKRPMSVREVLNGHAGLFAAGSRLA